MRGEVDSGRGARMVLQAHVPQEEGGGDPAAGDVASQTSAWKYLDMGHGCADDQAEGVARSGEAFGGGESQEGRRHGVEGEGQDELLSPQSVVRKKERTRRAIVVGYSISIEK